ncbi:casparian strip membrane protein 1-like [Cynara cardunculus var. scolymus]|uniref:casparian strip membrane protein 1-like n=1 Tax=Cynara cardunculus var. scolymus TaxID=59895 RepID=UPI000D6298C8|nr:casparian strip membrane protein 1-like [Cynara cardunculus var. scolymus]
MEGDSTAISIVETPKERKGKAPLLAAPPGGSSSSTKPVVVQPAAAATKGDRYKRGLAVFDVVVRLAGVATALAAAIAMASTEQTLPFFTQFFQFQAGYDDLPAFTFFVVANAITASYLVLSIPISIVCIIRPHTIKPRVVLMFFDTAMVALTTSAAGGAASIVYLAHNGNGDANWPAICQQFNDFCQKASGAVVASFLSVVVLMVLVVLSAFSL